MMPLRSLISSLRAVSQQRSMARAFGRPPLLKMSDGSRGVPRPLALAPTGRTCILVPGAGCAR
eukprot:4170468-Pyramimonas_sp.AAC.1